MTYGPAGDAAGFLSPSREAPSERRRSAGPAPAGHDLGFGAVKPPLAYRFLTWLYDPVVRWATDEAAFRDALLRRVAAEARPGARVLDLGCGTGSFALGLARRRRDLAIVGLDGDPTALAIARRKAASLRSGVQWKLGRAERLPFADDSFDLATSSLFFHHLKPGAKVTAARELARTLAPGATLWIADWTRPGNFRRSLGFLLVQLLDGFTTTRDHRRGALGEIVARGGLDGARLESSLDVPLGTIGLWRVDRGGGACAAPEVSR